MSIVRKSAAPAAPEQVMNGMSLEPMAEIAPPTYEHEPTKPTMPGSGILHLNLHGVYSAEQLMNGVTWSTKDFDVGAVPEGRVIIDQITSEAIGSNVASNLMVSANLFNSGEKNHYLQSGVTNGVGWVTSAGQSQLVPLGFAPIVSMMPNEYSRNSTVHYRPGSGVDDGLMQRYGHLSSGENLRKNIVAFPGEDYYYVAKDHVVLDIIERNWDALGQDVPGERVREGNWIKVSDKLVDKVLDELNSKVLKHMPLTDLNTLQFKMKADKTLASYLDDEKDFPVSLTLAVSYRSIAPELIAS
jgi:hypothetical protein